MKRIFIADDHAIVREGVKKILAMCPEFVLAGEAEDGDKVVEKLEELAGCDLLLLDMTMPGLSGIPLIRRVKARHPRLPVLIFSMHNEPALISEALDAGAADYVTKDSDPEVLIATLLRVMHEAK
jgi:DNA-binding NarL/FixJ family response regulator